MSLPPSASLPAARSARRGARERGARRGPAAGGAPRGGGAGAGSAAAGRGARSDGGGASAAAARLPLAGAAPRAAAALGRRRAERPPEPPHRVRSENLHSFLLPGGADGHSVSSWGICYNELLILL